MTKPDSPEQQKKGFWNKAEQISRVYHNIMDGSFKLLLMIGIVAALVFGVGIYYKTTSGFDTAKNWGCEYLNPFCDTESEIASKLAKEQAASEAAKAAEVASGPEEPGVFSRTWSKVTGWFSDDATAKP